MILVITSIERIGL